MRKTLGGQSAMAAKQIANHLDRIPCDTYVEPFLGIGNVYRARQKHPKREVLNDIDCRRIKEAKNRSCNMKSTTECKIIKNANVLCNKDYTAFLRRYDNPNTLIYLDPPYHTTVNDDKQYKHNKLNFEGFVKNVKNIRRANVAISYSDKPEFKREFCGINKGFKCHKIKKQIFGNHYNEILAVKS